MQNNLNDKTQYKLATQEELMQIMHLAPTGMVKMVQHRTNATRQKVRYQIYNMPVVQDEEIVTALREILEAVTENRYDEDSFVQATPEELKWIDEVMPKGMVKMVEHLTGRSRQQVRYQLYGAPKSQDGEIITALREILFAVIQKRYTP